MEAPRRGENNTLRAGAGVEGETTGGGDAVKGDVSASRQTLKFVNFKTDHVARAKRPTKGCPVVWWARHGLIRQPETMLGLSQGFSGALRGLPDARDRETEVSLPPHAYHFNRRPPAVFFLCVLLAPMLGCCFALLFIIETDTPVRFMLVSNAMRVMPAFGHVDVLGGWCQGRLKASGRPRPGGGRTPGGRTTGGPTAPIDLPPPASIAHDFCSCFGSILTDKKPWESS